MLELDERTQKLTGVVRTTVQGLFAYLLAAWTPYLEALGVSDEFGALEEPVTALAVAVILGAYWYVLTTLQNSKFGQDPLVAALLSILMGGRNAPSYIEAEVIDTAAETVDG